MTPRRLTLAALVSSLLLTSCSGSGAGDAGQSPAPGDPTGSGSPPAATPTGQQRGWERLPDPPLSPRSRTLGVHVAGLVLELGGSDADWGGGPYQRPMLQDGAALDLATGTWRSVEPAPWPPAEAPAHVVVGDRLLLARNRPGAWAVYDSGDDTWGRVPAPPVGVPQPSMTVRGEQVFVLDEHVVESRAPVQVLDLATNTWSALPASRHRPAIDGRTLVATDSGLVVMGEDLFPRRAGRHRQPALAEIWDGTRWRRFQSDHAAGTGWHWTGERVISTYRVPRRESARGGLHEYRASAFDPATGEWEQLPWLPARRGGLLEEAWPRASGPRVLSGGYLYDDGSGDSRPVESPSSWGSSTQTLAGDAIVLFGGAKPRHGRWGRGPTELVLTNRAWILAT